MFQYNEESAMKAGGVVRENGAYHGVITDAIYKRANSGSAGLELTLETQDGSEFKYLTLWYKKADNTEIKGGASMINAIMGIMGLQQLSEQQVGLDNNQKPLYQAPEMIGKGIGFVLQKVLYTKNDGSDGYKFEIRLPFNPQTKQTLKEFKQNIAPAMVERIVSTLVDKDERNNQGAMPSPANNGFNNQAPQQQPTSFDDDIGF